MLETLVALTVAAIAASVILSQVRGLIAREEQKRSHERDALQLVNDGIRLSVFQGKSRWYESPAENKETLMIEPEDKGLPQVTVRNFSITDVKTPPIQLAFTPLQQYTVERGRQTLTIIAPSLPRPDMILPARKDDTKTTKPAGGSMQPGNAKSLAGTGP